MKLSTLLHLAHSARLAPQAHRAHDFHHHHQRAPRPSPADGFVAARKAPVSLGVPASTPPSPNGPVAVATSADTAQPTTTEQLRQLIAADVMTSQGRPATDADYDYWLPKLQSPCDSGFVTSGQMTGVEYYHRRMLGWQAGGADVAKFGPYAGGPDAHGPVPSAAEVVAGLGQPAAPPPAAPTPTPQGTPSTDQLRQLIAADVMTSSGRPATDADYDYWLPKLQSPCDSGFVTSGQMTGVEYYHRRMLGWQAGGSDVAKYGPYAGGPDAHGPVPPATEVISGLGQPAAPAPVAPAPLPATTSTEQLRQLIAADVMTAQGREATDADYGYWLPKLQSPCDSGFVTSGQMTGVEYYHRRMLGWQAGGADSAKFGPYAGSPEAMGPVPSATDVVGPLIAP